MIKQLIQSKDIGDVMAFHRIPEKHGINVGYDKMLFEIEILGKNYFRKTSILSM
ncbi:MAG: hypothetical protein HQ557_06670 [Bacteroidetes bacterium]|nr:hypothetical protein [Bacteroidota bacterium]